jgi:hypothetical protein
MTWFSVGNVVEWETPKGITMSGEIVTILEPGQIAEDILDEKERTKISTKNLNAQVTPMSRRALVKVVDHRGWVTYHTQRLGRLMLKEPIVEINMNDVMRELKELRELMEKSNEAMYRNNSAVVRTIR